MIEPIEQITPNKLEEKSHLFSLLRSEAMIIASFPILLYLFTYVRHFGTINKFHLPVSLITFEAMESIHNIGYILLIIAYTLFFFRMLFAVMLSPIIGFKNIKEVISLSFSSLLPLFIYGVLLSEENRLLQGILYGLFLLLMNIFILVPIALFCSEEGLSKSLKEQITFIKNWKILSLLLIFFLNLLLKVEDSWGKFRGIGILIVLYINILLFAYVIGIYSAEKQTNYFVINTTEECVVLYNSSNRAICSPFSRSSGEVEPSYMVLYYEDSQGIIFKNENIGPLQLKLTHTPTRKPTSTPTRTVTPFPTNTLTRIPDPTDVP